MGKNKLKSIGTMIMATILTGYSFSAISFPVAADLMNLHPVSYISSTAASQKSGFYVDGTTIRDANGNAFVMRGTNQKVGLASAMSVVLLTLILLVTGIQKLVEKKLDER